MLIKHSSLLILPSAAALYSPCFSSCLCKSLNIFYHHHPPKKIIYNHSYEENTLFTLNAAYANKNVQYYCSLIMR